MDHLDWPPVDGSRDDAYARTQLDFWEQTLMAGSELQGDPSILAAESWSANPPRIISNLSPARFITAIERAQRYIWSGTSIRSISRID